MRRGTAWRATLARALPLALALVVAAACDPADPAAGGGGSKNGVEPGTPGEEAARIAEIPGYSDRRGPNPSPPDGKAITDPAVLEGIGVYRAQFCGTCHRLSLAGTAGIFGPSHDSLRATAERRVRDPGYTGSATTAEGYVRESVLRPGAYRVPGFEHTRFLMPAYTKLSESDLEALVRMLLWDPTTDGGRP